MQIMGLTVVANLFYFPHRKKSRSLGRGMKKRISCNVASMDNRLQTASIVADYYRPVWFYEF
jgi:hypothetical protein